MSEFETQLLKKTCQLFTGFLHYNKDKILRMNVEVKIKIALASKSSESKSNSFLQVVLVITFSIALRQL